MPNIQDVCDVIKGSSGNDSSCSKDGNGHTNNLNLEVARMIEIIFSVWICAVIGFFGSAANIINIVIFFKQGFSDSVNISLCALAISDLGAILPLLWRSVSLNPLFLNIDFGSTQLQYKRTGWMHRYFVLITSWITAIITFERCVCIALPLKVKSIITTKRTFVLMVFVFVLISASVFPVFFVINIIPSYESVHNISQHDLMYINYAFMLENICFNVNLFEQLSSFFIIIICTVVLIHNLTALSKWRHTANVSSLLKSDPMPERDKRVVRMVTFISIIFIACYLPGTANTILSIFLSLDYRIGGLFQAGYQISWSIISVLEVINSSINILVYYSMSSKYRTTFNKLFRNYRSGT